MDRNKVTEKENERAAQPAGSHVAETREKFSPGEVAPIGPALQAELQYAQRPSIFG